MIKKWVKLLPYFIVVWLTRKCSPSQIKFDGKYVMAWRIDKGEWFVWNQENYNIMYEREQKNKQEKINRRRRKYEELKFEFEPEETEDGEY